MFNIKEGIVICDNDIKMNILKRRTKLINYKFYSLKQLKENLLGNIKPSAKYYLFNKYNYSLDFTNELFKYIHYLDVNKIYESSKLENIKNIKIDLINNKYYEINYKFIDILKRFNVTFVNVLEIDENKLLIDIVKNITTIDVINYNHVDKKIPYYQALNQEEELINYLELVINNNYDLNKVVFTNYNSDYLHIFKKLSYDYKIDFNIENNVSLISNKYIKFFLNNIELDFNELIEKIYDNDIKNKIIEIINKYEIEVNSLKESKLFLIEVFKNESYKSTKYLNGIRVSNSLCFNDDDIVFFLNFNVDMPKFKNNTYLSDHELSCLNMSTVIEYNKIYKSYFLNNLSNINNLYLSFPFNLKNGQNLESTLIDELNLDKRTVTIALTHSYVLNKQILTNHYDNYVLYNKENDLLNKYKLDALEYNNYDNSFKQFKYKLDNQVIDNVKLSYSTMKTFFQCPFKYYLDNVLKVKKYTKLIGANLGTYAHHMLEKSYNEDFDYNKVKEDFIAEAKFTPKEIVFALFMDDVLKNVLEFNNIKESLTDFTDCLREENITLKINNTLFTGFIDKILLKEEGNNVYVAIIDYKTGSDEMKLNNIDDGLNLQLPVYTYLIKNADKFKGKNVFIIGLYLQKVEIKKIEDLDKISDNYKLQGFTFNNLELINMIDRECNKTYIKGLKRNKDGSLAKNSKLIDDESISHILELVPQLVSQIEDAYNNVDFPINPYKLDDETGCKYCEYKRVCYKTEKDYRELKKESGDDNNGLDE